MKRSKRRKASRGGSVPGWAWVLGGAGIGAIGYLVLRPRTAAASIRLPGTTGAAPGVTGGGMHTTPIVVPGVQTSTITGPIVLQDQGLVQRYPNAVTAAERRAVITVLQRQLIALGFSVGSHGADGSEGTGTLTAERAFLARYGLPASMLGDDAVNKRQLIQEVDIRYHLARGI